MNAQNSYSAVTKTSKQKQKQQTAPNKYTDSCQLVFLSGYHSLHLRVKLQPVPNSSPLKGHTEKYLSPRQKLLFAIHSQWSLINFIYLFSSSIQVQDISNSMSVQQMEEPESRGRFHIQLQEGFKTDCMPIQSLRRQTPQSVPWQRLPWLPLQKLCCEFFCHFCMIRLLCSFLSKPSIL